MRSLALQDQHIIAAGCGTPSCKDYTLAFLETCDLAQMHQVNIILKDIILSDEMQGVDSDTLKDALIAAIQNANF